MANASGFGGQRGEHTWATRVKKLQELRFIDVKSGKSGPMSNVLIWNPHLVLRWHHQEGTPGLTEASYNALIEWALEIGAKDMTDPLAPVPEPGSMPAPVAPPVPRTIKPRPGSVKKVGRRAAPAKEGE